jgi:hypothetical protein
MPFATRQHQGRGAVAFLGLLFRLIEDAAFQRLPLLILLVEIIGDVLGPVWRVRGEQLDGQPRGAEPAGGVKPRGQDEGDVGRLESRLAGQARTLDERLQS